MPDTNEGGKSDNAQEIAWVDGAKRVVASNPVEFLKQLNTSTRPAYLVVEISLRAQHTDPVPVKAGTCATDCVPSATREGFQVRVRLASPEEAERNPPVPGEEPNRGQPKRWFQRGSLARVFPTEPHEFVRHRWWSQLSRRLQEPLLSSPDDRWVAIGVIKMVVQWDKNTPVLAFKRRSRYMRRVFSNDSLSKLIFALSNRVDEALRVRVLTHAGYHGQSGEGQTGPVYQKLKHKLCVQVVDGKNQTPPADPSSIRVEFNVLTKDGGAISSSSGAAGPFAVDAAGKVEVAWTLGKAPGLHTVAARIVPSSKAPPFHPGSQIVFHATATPTAPTIVGMEFLQWHIHHSCSRWNHGNAILRIIFSREIDRDALSKPEEWLQVWRMIQGKSAPVQSPAQGGAPKISIPIGPHSIGAELVGMPQPLGAAKDPDACWYVDYALKHLLDNLCENDTLRIMVSIRPTEELVWQSPGSPAQVVSARFDGSFTTRGFRDALWNNANPLDGPGEAAVQYFQEITGHYWDANLPPVTQDEAEGLAALWDRFRVRESCLPSGDGHEGGDFHKAFELRLP